MDYPLLVGLKENDRRAVLDVATRRRFKRGEVIFHEGDLGDTFHLIARGRVVIRTTTRDGDVATLAVLGAGTGFGEQAILDPASRRTATAVAIEAAETIALTRGTFEELQDRHPQVQQFLITYLAQRVRDLSALLAEAMYLPADKRVLRRLLALADLYQEEPVPFTQGELARLAGTTRSTTNRVLRAAVDDGLIRLARGRINVLDRDGVAHRSR
jgi:CRP/FNR family transcriptional regulator, cyclic AMP receptor protein